jgi:NAD(P)H dehydrogenase (quinone)
MKKKIVVLLGHPNDRSFSGKMAEHYIKGAKLGKAQIKYVKLKDLKFDALNIRKELEIDLKEMQKLILWSDHLVVVFPTWWGSAPALMKGFFDRVMTPGFAFKYRKDKLGWHKLLKGRSARIINVTGGPWLLNHLVYRNSAINSMRWATLWFAGFSPVRVTEFNGINTKWSSEKKRKSWLAKLEKVGERDAGQV